MKRLIFLVVLCLLLCGGCAYFTPEVSKAITEGQQYEELKKQTALMERIAVALEKIAREKEKEAR